MGTLLEAHGVEVRYGATTALCGIDFDLRAGEVHAVVGENGAGKSTLLRVLAGVVTPNTGRTVRVATPAWVPQETSLPADLTATEWIFLGHELRTRFGWLRRRAMLEAAREALRDLGATVAADARLGTLTAPQQKQVQLARALRAQPAVLLLDEPTAVLGESESQHLFRAIHDFKRRGAAVLYVTHRLDEVRALADRVTVLRDGSWVSTDSVGAVDTKILVHRMVGRDIEMPRRRERTLGSRLLSVSELRTAHVTGFSMTVDGGEVVGLAGLVGAGRSEVLEAIAGLRRVTSGRIRCAAAAQLVPEDRGRNGLVPTLTLRGNVFLPSPRRWLRPRAERRELASWIDRLRIRTHSPDAAIDSLSGGNQQKVLLARALRHQPRLLLLDEPTAGVDIGAKAEIHELIRGLAAGGAGIVLASSDLPELLLLCDRIVALRGGVTVGEVAAAEASEPRLAALITGAIGADA